MVYNTWRKCIIHTCMQRPLLAVDIDFKNNWFSNLIQTQGKARQSKTIRHVGEKVSRGFENYRICIHTTGKKLVGMHISSDKTGGTPIQLIVINHYVNTFFQSHMTFNLIDFMIWREQLEMSIGTKALRLMFYGLSRGVLSSIAYCSVIANWQIPRKLAPSTSHLLTIHMN